MKVKLTVPDSLKDIKLSQYQKFIAKTKDLEDTNLVNKKAVAIFCNLTEDLVGQLQAKDYDSLVNRINTILSNDGELQTTFIYNGVKYGLIPNLEEITVDEQADIDLFINDVGKWDSLMKVIYRPVEKEHKGKYTIKEYTGKEENLDLPMSIVNPAIFFFINTLKDLLSCIPNFIKQQAKIDKRLQTLVENGDGINHFMDLLEEIFSSSMKSAS